MSVTIIARIIARHVPARLVLLAAVLGLAIGAEMTQNQAYYRLIAAAFTCGLLLTRQHWIGRRTGRIALLLTAGAIAATLAVGGDLVRVMTIAARLSDVLILILSVTLIRPALMELKLDHAIAAMAARAPGALRGCAVVAGVAIFSLGLSFGAVSVFGGSLRGRTNDDAVAARAAMRGLSLSMLLGPSTASVAAVMTTYPRVGWGEALRLGVPIAVAGAALGSFAARRLTIEAQHVSRTDCHRTICAVLAVPGGAVLLHLGFGLSVTLGIAASAIVVSIGLLILATGAARAWSPALLRFDAQIGDAWAQASGETALFLACGLVLGAMREPVIAESARAFVVPLLPVGLPGLLLLTVAVPLITTLGIHPMALFAILGPVVTPALLGLSEPAVFQAWIVVIGLSMMVSPASILTMTTVSGFGVNADALCLRGNGLYALGVGVMAVAGLFISR